MVIDTRNILQSAGTAAEYFLKETLGGELFEDLRPINEAEVSCTALYDGETVKIKGTLKIDLELVCDRCIETYVYRLELPFDETFRNIEGDEEEIYQYTGYMLPLDKMLHDLIILNYPAKCLCRDDCEGIRINTQV